MKIQSPAILAIGLVVSLVSAISASVAPNGAAAAGDPAFHRTAALVDGRRAGVTAAISPLTVPVSLTGAERLASGR